MNVSLIWPISTVKKRLKSYSNLNKPGRSLKKNYPSRRENIRIRNRTFLRRSRCSRDKVISRIRLLTLSRRLGVSREITVKLIKSSLLGLLQEPRKMIIWLKEKN
jgi:hypothetical protein